MSLNCARIFLMNSFLKKNFLLYSAYLITFLWSVVLSAVATYNSYNYYETADLLALNEAQVSVRKDLAYRSWVASHGGVYVPITQDNPPNPYLSHIKNRDFQALDRNFTLINPAYALSQIMGRYSQLYGTKTKITSLKLLNPKNAPDNWEKNALATLETVREPFYEKTNVGEKKYLRYIMPLIVKKDCMKCHVKQGYHIGELRGGISVTVSLEEHYGIADYASLLLIFSLIVLWFAGLAFIYFTYRKIKKSVEARADMYEQNIYSLVEIIEKRDSYTAGHTKRVAKYSKLIAQEMGFNDEKIELLYRAAMLHDIGKISTPDSILLKPGKLSDLEYSLIKDHVVSSYDILKSVDIFSEISEIARHHHECYDGKGYPQGLSGTQVPLLSYILSLADAFDAMTTNRIYKNKKNIESAFKELQEKSGTQFHPDVVRHALVALKNIRLDHSINQKPNTIMERQRFAYFYIDQLTALHNRDYLEFILAHRNLQEYNYNCAYIVYLHHFTEYNKEFGWNAGNELLKSFSKDLSQVFSKALIFRVFGDDFVVLNEEHMDFTGFDSFVSIKNTKVKATYKHIDLHDKIYNIHTLEGMI